MKVAGLLKDGSSMTINPTYIFVRFFDMSVVKESIAKLLTAKKGKKPSMTTSKVVQKKRKSDDTRGQTTSKKKPRKESA